MDKITRDLFELTETDLALVAQVDAKANRETAELPFAQSLAAGDSHHYLLFLLVFWPIVNHFHSLVEQGIPLFQALPNQQAVRAFFHKAGRILHAMPNQEADHRLKWQASLHLLCAASDEQLDQVPRVPAVAEIMKDLQSEDLRTRFIGYLAVELIATAISELVKARFEACLAASPALPAIVVQFIRILLAWFDEHVHNPGSVDTHEAMCWMGIKLLENGQLPPAIAEEVMGKVHLYFRATEEALGFDFSGFPSRLPDMAPPSAQTD